MIDLNVDPHRVTFVLSAEPVTITGPDGHPLRVAAATLTGEGGVITFDYQLILRRVPTLMMALITHEMGHKVAFPSGTRGERSYVEDDEPVLHFASGRALLDAAGLAVANFARRRGLIGEKFSVRDRFYCKVSIVGTGVDFFQSGDDDRTLLSDPLSERPFDRFVSGIGPQRRVQIGVTHDNSCISVEVLLHEESGCAPDGNLSERFVDLKVYRIFRPDADGHVDPPQVLNERRFPQWNPACEEDAAMREQAMNIGVDLVTFSCIYKGMGAATNVSAALNRRSAGQDCL